MAVEVVGRQFTAPGPVDLTIVPKTGVTDAAGNIMFKITRKFLSSRRIFLDAAGNPILTLQQKTSRHNAWTVYRGDSKHSNDLLFSVRDSAFFQSKTQMDVFLASNTSKINGDFKIKGSSHEKSFTIYAGNSSTVIAQMDVKHSLRSIAHRTDKVSVTVYPNVDYAFIAALIVILEEINQPDKNIGEDIKLDRLEQPLQYLLNAMTS